VNPRGTVGSPATAVEQLDLLQQHFVLFGSIAFWSSPPFVKASSDTCKTLHISAIFRRFWWVPINWYLIYFPWQRSGQAPRGAALSKTGCGFFVSHAPDAGFHSPSVSAVSLPVRLPTPLCRGLERLCPLYPDIPLSTWLLSLAIPLEHVSNRPGRIFLDSALLWMAIAWPDSENNRFRSE
jgi:hypothetical protein